MVVERRTKSSRGWRGRRLEALGVVALAWSCTTPRTEVFVRLVTDLEWGTDAFVRSIVVTVRSRDPEGPLRLQRVIPVGRSARSFLLPASFGIIPLDGDDGGVFWIEAAACRGEQGCAGVGDGGASPAVVTQRAWTSFVTKATTEIELFLADACRDVPCTDPRLSCDPRLRQCVDAQVASHPPDAPPDAGMPPCPAEMVQMPAGEFLMGSPEGEGASLEHPPHRVRLTAFCIDRTEVTVARYTACVEAGGCAAPVATFEGCNWGVTGRAEHPINCVRWAEANVYCRWAGKTLPTEARWEYAARGRDGRRYPWGNDSPGDQLCWSGRGARTSTCAVGSFPTGASSLGVLDLAGNAWEWTADWLGAYSATAERPLLDPTGPATGLARVFRGGAWTVATPDEMRATARGGNAPLPSSIFLGFRCAR